VIRQYWSKQPRLVARPAPISLDLRLRIVGAVENGSSIRGAAGFLPQAAVVTAKAPTPVNVPAPPPQEQRLAVRAPFRIGAGPASMGGLTVNR
jgi:hypothetical protein